jgi:hypothetical protein
LGPHNQEHIAAKIVLRDREASKESDRHNKIHGKLSEIEERLVAVEDTAKRPEHKTWAFRFGVIGILIALLALIVSWVAWQRPKEPVAIKPSNASP